ncbi:hypothetical protein KUTeg_000488 [Tegillarca granosa]|uniref:Uncharacterized protein n=1 Tax=Tegillarca granosa TaxID=220873 RepID=A0ABQ9G135_TEGGR|nr:hypothetical protein KUTeg_000488 [Tegillarca granosa]
MASSSNPARTTVCITEAFGFLDDPDYDKDPQALKKSTSDTNLFVSSDKKFDDLQARIYSLSTKGKESNSYTSQSDASLLQNKNDTYTIITYLGNEKTSVDKHLHVHDSGIGTDDLDVSDNFTIVTYIDDQPKPKEKYDSDARGLGESFGKADDKESIFKGDNRKNDINGYALEEYKLNVNDNYRNSEDDTKQPSQHIGGNSHMIGNKQSAGGSNLRTENEVIMRHLPIDSDISRHSGGVIEEVVMRRQSTNTDESRSRRTQQIVSDAFHFLKELDYCDPDAISSYSLSFHEDTNKDLHINDLQMDENLHVPKIEQIDSSSPMPSILSLENKTAENQIENCIGKLSRTNETAITNVSNVNNKHNPVIRRQQFQRQNKELSASQDEYTDDSSDEDTGIYNESFRNSCWLKVADNMSLSSVQESLEDDSYIPSATHELPNVQTNDQSDQKERKDEVFLEDNDQSHDYRGHNRSDSVTTTLSEREFKKQYNFRRKCLVKRNDSQQEYHRLSAKLYENEKVIIIEKDVEDKDFGLHIIDSHPAIITNVDKDPSILKIEVASNPPTTGIHVQTNISID